MLTTSYIDDLRKEIGSFDIDSNESNIIIGEDEIKWFRIISRQNPINDQYTINVLCQIEQIDPFNIVPHDKETHIISVEELEDLPTVNTSEDTTLRNWNKKGKKIAKELDNIFIDLYDTKPDSYLCTEVTDTYDDGTVAATFSGFLTIDE